MAKFKINPKISHWFHDALNDNLLRVFLALWLLPLISIILYSVIFVGKLPAEIPLFYSHLWGENQLAAKNFIFLPPLGSLLLGIFNFALAINNYSKDKVASYLLAGTATLISLLSSITIFNIINLML